MITAGRGSSDIGSYSGFCVGGGVGVLTFLVLLLRLLSMLGSSSGFSSVTVSTCNDLFPHPNCNELVCNVGIVLDVVLGEINVNQQQFVRDQNAFEYIVKTTMV